jgi:hypothetical protein
MIFGIRSEDIFSPISPLPAIMYADVEFKIDVTELIENFIYLVVCRYYFLDRLDIHSQHKIGKKVKLTFN